MAKTASQRQAEYIQRKKNNDADFNKKEAERKRLKRKQLKLSPAKHEAAKAKDRGRKQKKVTETTDGAGNSSFTNKQSFGKAKAKVLRNLPKQKERKVAVIGDMLKSLSPSSKRNVFKAARRTITLNNGRPGTSEETKAAVLGFLERPDISYCCPGRQDTVYCGKDDDGKKIYKSKQYLLWTIREIVALYNNDNDMTISYHVVQKVISENKHIFKVGDTPDDDCRCEHCENVELLLIGINRSLKENKFDNLLLPVDPETFISKIVCSVKKQECCYGTCDQCSDENESMKEVMNALMKIEAVTYCKWIRRQNYVKEEFIDSGKDAANLLREVCQVSFRKHMYNIYHQYSELKYVKMNLKENEAILSVDFSKNYENKQRNEIQSAYFGHEAFTIFTAACYFKAAVDDTHDLRIDEDTGLHILPIVVISNQTVHERNIAFACNNKVIDTIQHYLPLLSRVYFWSDGCASQFRSQFVFRSLSYYPDNIKISWDYGEAHHFKGPHDGLGGTVKRKVYEDVTTFKVVVKDARHFAEYANKVCKINVEYLDMAEIRDLQLADDSVYIPGTLQIHHVNRLSKNTVEFRYNSPYKTESKLLKCVTYNDDLDDTNTDFSAAEISMEVQLNSTEIEPEDIALKEREVEEGQWVKVIYEGEYFIGKVMDKNNGQVQVRCLEKPLGINTPQALERENDAIYYATIFYTGLKPELKKCGRKWLYMY